MRRLTITIATTFIAAATGLAAAPAAVAGNVAHDKVVSADPVDYTPHVLDGRVHALAVVQGTVIVGGEFSAAKEAGAFFGMRRHNLLAFDADTGEINWAFSPQVDGAVHALAPGPHGTVFVGGSFSHVNGAPQHGLAQLDVSTGRAVGTFAATSLDSGQVNALAADGNWLYVGGRFTGIDGVERKALARLDLRTGSVDRTFDLQLAEPRRGALSVQAMALSPDGSQLVIDGTFTRASGKRRYQIAMINTAASPPRLANWSTKAYTDKCLPAFHTYMRGIDFAPDGSYFVVVTTGGEVNNPKAMCDSAARWEAGARGTNLQPTWVNRTGGDSLYAVVTTGAAVYIGGHQRWVSNPKGHNAAGPGAVPRKGIAALDPRTGEALAWNPTRARGHGVEALVATPHGLFVGSDTERLGHEFHARIGKFPIE